MNDELYDLTAAEVDEPMWPPYFSPASTSTVAHSPSVSPIRFVLWMTLLAVWLTLLAAALFTVSQTFTNWFDGNGFTPISHHGVVGVVPSVQDSEWAPGQRTVLVLPAEEAQR